VAWNAENFLGVQAEYNKKWAASRNEGFKKSSHRHSKCFCSLLDFASFLLPESVRNLAQLNHLNMLKATW